MEAGKKTVLFFILILNFFISDVIAQTVLPFNGGSDTSINFVKKSDESISLREIIKGKEREVDRYEVGDGVPIIETFFFDKINKESKLIVLVSWDERNISAVYYKIHIYEYNDEEVLGKDKYLFGDKRFEGYEGYDGNGMVFNLKSESEIKNYLHGEMSIKNH